MNYGKILLSVVFHPTLGSPLEGEVYQRTLLTPTKAKNSKSCFSRAKQHVLEEDCGIMDRLRIKGWVALLLIIAGLFPWTILIALLWFKIT